MSATSFIRICLAQYYLAGIFISPSQVYAPERAAASLASLALALYHLTHLLCYSNTFGERPLISQNVTLLQDPFLALFFFSITFMTTM